MQLEKELLRQKIKGLLVEILSIYTPSGEEERAKDFFEKVSKEFNLPLEISKHNSYFLGKGDILLASHIDTVPGFIQPKVEGGFIYGRGAVDAKGPLIAMLLATYILNERGYKVQFAALADEEGKSKGARELVNSGIRYNYIIVGEPSNTFDVIVEYRGVLHLDILCKGNSQHSSSSKENLIIDLSKKILEIYREPINYDDFSIVPTIIKSGDYINMTPSEGYLHLDIRYSTKNSKDEILGLIRNEFKTCDIKIVEDIEPVKVDVNSNIVKAVMRGIIKQGYKPKLARKAGTSDMNILKNISKEIVTYGPGNSMLEHTNNEKISIDEIFIALTTYINAIEELCLKKK
ncbi:N-acetyl-lysine deacetylase [Sulfolobus sp. S-194]|uniref:N-acetyl-lysine deacetylase n=1 Tax=Sulfolobus sp. S-194 TaxID=2512240 RepID=UPI001437000F|nr:N-acetyl-lysine deacetylase [Sulfolobus sp. S-194]QIW23023.1 N-acetyl-lysine deacetylase [Sulfolobus sp. S-194]